MRVVRYRCACTGQEAGRTASVQAKHGRRVIPRGMRRERLHTTVRNTIQVGNHNGADAVFPVQRPE